MRGILVTALLFFVAGLAGLGIEQASGLPNIGGVSDLVGDVPTPGDIRVFDVRIFCEDGEWKSANEYYWKQELGKPGYCEKRAITAA